MLKNTFIHIPGIGIKTEERLWESGIRDWDYLMDDIPMPVSQRRRLAITEGIQESKRHLRDNNSLFFSDLIPSNQCWRLFSEFRESIVYLDIETTGLDRYFNEITTITLYDGQSIKTYVQGQNLNDFLEDIQRYKVIVTYNGKCFDVPFIERYFNIQLNHAHIDLRYILYSLGFKGGLKGCENQLGMDRGNLRGVDGYFAVLLWNEYQKDNDQKVLDTLLAYNVQDTITLENLMVIAYNMKLKETPFYSSHQQLSPDTPVNPFKADLETIERIKFSHAYDVSKGGY